MDWRKEEGILRNSDGFGLGTVSERAVGGIRSCVRESVERLEEILSCLGEGPWALRLGVLNFGSWAEPGAGDINLSFQTIDMARGIVNTGRAGLKKTSHASGMLEFDYGI